MDRQQLDRALPPGIRDFNDWEQRIPKYQTPLMRKLDTLELKLHPERWDRAALYEIVLWELNRYPELDDQLFQDLAGAARIAPGQHREGRELLERLLQCRNVGLTMATAILRFVNPDTFQTLNARNSAVVMGARTAPEHPSGKITREYLDAAAEYYFSYLDELRRLTGDGFDFRWADRLLYQVDKAGGRKLRAYP